MIYITRLRSSANVNGVQPICLSANRQAFLRTTHRRGRSVPRGRGRRVSARGVVASYRARTRLQEKADGEDEVPSSAML